MRAAARALPIASFALAVIAGAAWLHRAGAPEAWVAINLGALALGLVLLAGLWRLPPRPVELAALVAAPAMALLALAAGSGVDGVHRWIELGQLRLHAAMLGGPAFVVALARRPGWLGTAAAAVLTVAIALQPDAGTALALAAATAALALGQRSASRLAALLAALGGLAWCATAPDPLTPVTFVEAVIPAMLVAPGALPIAALAMLTLALLVSALVGGREGLALAAWGAALVIASLLGAFPVPLLGYGAAPIIGYAAALGIMGGRRT